MDDHDNRRESRSPEGPGVPDVADEELFPADGQRDGGSGPDDGGSGDHVDLPDDPLPEADSDETAYAWEKSEAMEGPAPTG